MRILTRKKYFTLYNRAIKDTLLYLEICFCQKREKYYVSNTLRTKNISNFATPLINEIIIIHYKQIKRLANN